MNSNPTPHPENCTCASFFTVRGVHKPDCPCSVAPHPEIVSTAERIVIDYANFSGRESEYRAEFRQAVITHLSHLVETIREEERANLTKNVGMLRQWLNEERIPFPAKMVTNEELLVWLSPSKE